MKLSLRRDFRSAASIRADIQQFYSKPLTRVSFELIVSILTVIVFALFALRPTLITMSELLRDIQEKQVLDEQLGEKISSLATAQSEFLVYQPQILALDSVIMRNASLEEVAYYLESLIADSGLQVQRLAFGQIPVITTFPEDSSRTQPVLTKYQAQIVVEGELSDLQEFLARVEQVKPLFSVNGWSVSPTASEDRPPIESAINIAVYIYTDPAVLQSVRQGGSR